MKQTFIRVFLRLWSEEQLHGEMGWLGIGGRRGWRRFLTLWFLRSYARPTKLESLGWDLRSKYFTGVPGDF